MLTVFAYPPHLPIRRQAARDGVSQERRKNVGEMVGEARFSREMAAARGLIGDPAQARRDSPDPGRRHDGRGHLAAIFRAARAARLLNEPRASDSIDLLTFTGLQLHAPRLTHVSIFCIARFPRQCISAWETSLPSPALHSDLTASHA